MVSSLRRILVVDDNVDTATTLAMLLRLTGNDVQTAYDGPSSLKVAAAYRPDVVLLDIGLPGMDGYAVAQQLRAHPGLNGTVLVALTGYASEGDRQRSQDTGFHAHVAKPVDFHVLQELLASLGSPRLASGGRQPPDVDRPSGG
jgi:CheY-like chemotaxis protein